MKILDASWYLPNQGRDARKEYRRKRLQGARFFDLDNHFSDTSCSLPHMLPTPAQFSAAIRSLGVSPGSFVVAYDGMGMISSPRAWWTFKAFGWPHGHVAVLDGGLPKFEQEFPDLVSLTELSEEDIDAERESAYGSTLPFEATLQKSRYRDVREIEQNLKTKREVVVDARSSGRFLGTAPEPRPGLKSGHMPNSLNVFFQDVYASDGTLKTPEELKQVFCKAGVPLDGTPLVTSCGSGVTAAVLSLALECCGLSENVSLYDGSWSEYAQPGHEDTRPIVA